MAANEEMDFIGLDKCEMNEGFNSKLDYFGKLNCRVFVDQDLRLKDEVVYAEPVAEEEDVDEPSGDDSSDAGDSTGDASGNSTGDQVDE